MKMGLGSSKEITPTLPTRQVMTNDPSEDASTFDVDSSPCVSATTTELPARKLMPIIPFSELIITLPDFSSAIY
jgi:hypothetical protein